LGKVLHSLLKYTAHILRRVKVGRAKKPVSFLDNALNRTQTFSPSAIISPYYKFIAPIHTGTEMPIFKIFKIVKSKESMKNTPVNMFPTELGMANLFLRLSLSFACVQVKFDGKTKN